MNRDTRSVRGIDGDAASLSAGTNRAAGIDHFVVFPTAECALAPSPLRHVACVALLRLIDGTIWCLRMRGAPWSPGRLAAAAHMLHHARSVRHETVALANRLSFELENSSLSVVAPMPDRVEPALWELRRTAIDVAMREFRMRDRRAERQELESRVAALESAFAAALDGALADFRQGLDREVLAELAALPGATDYSLYNYVVEAPFRSWRLQLARTFPIFVRAAANGGPGTPGATVRTAVDVGLPLVRHLAGQWDVGQSAIRHLLEVGVRTIGEQWTANVRGLVRVLDALRTEHRPKADAESWRRFNDAVAAAEQIFRRPPWTSPAALAWLRESARGGWVHFDPAEAQRFWDPVAIAAVERFRDAMSRMLRLAIAHRMLPCGSKTAVAIDATVDRYVSMRPQRKLCALAERFDRNVRNPSEAVARQRAFLAGEQFVSLIPGDLRSADGTRIVRPLTSAAALQRHGEAMQNCVGGTGYAMRCADAKSFIVGVFDADSPHAPRSTAEIALSRPLRGGVWPRLVEHTAHRNTQPSAQCKAALREALDLVRSDAGQRHLEAGLALARRRMELGESKAREEAERIHLDEAFARTLGPSAIDDLARVVERKVLAGEAP